MQLFKDIPLKNEWRMLLQDEFAKPYMQSLAKFLKSEEQAGKTIFPPRKDWFAALNLCAPKDIRIVILGQDPYHGAGQAHGLAFSVPKGVKIPPSLRNIYKEIQSDLTVDDMPRDHGCLEDWARHGALLLNTVLTVENSRAGSHQNQGWEDFTDAIIRRVNALDQPIVFMLWGKPAQKKQALLNNPNHLILTAPHPSPLSAHRGFLGCCHFSKANRFLQEQQRQGISFAV